MQLWQNLHHERREIRTGIESSVRSIRCHCELDKQLRNILCWCSYVRNIAKSSSSSRSFLLKRKQESTHRATRGWNNHPSRVTIKVCERLQLVQIHLRSCSCEDISGCNQIKWNKFQLECQCIHNHLDPEENFNTRWSGSHNWCHKIFNHFRGYGWRTQEIS